MDCKNSLLPWHFWRGVLNWNCALIPHSRSQRVHCELKEEVDAFAQREKIFFCLGVGKHALRKEYDQINLCAPVFYTESMSRLHAYFFLTDSDFVTYEHSVNPHEGDNW